ncbi:MAG TPA: GGDEF domain-containing protein [Burkholderiaceae bacterium]|nr:GGDEF domain-containing protein [Burkholderiaceae bacterium]
MNSAQASATPHRRTFDAEALARRRRLRLGMHALASSCYAMDALLLLLFAAADTITWTVATSFAAMLFVTCFGFYLLLRSSLPDRSRDHNLTAWHVGAASANQIIFLAVAPQLAFFYFLVLFNIFAFGAFRMSVRAGIVAWTAVAVASAAVVAAHGAAIALPIATPQEQTLVWLAFVVVLGRSVFLGFYGSGIRNELRRRHAALQASLKQIEELASRDELTGVLNRRSLLALLDNLIADAARDGTTFSIALLDLDNFKDVNDEHGHAAGDEVLAAFARTATAMLRTTDRFGRYGGDEFMLVMPDTGADAAAAVVARLRAAFDSIDWAGVQPRLSLGPSAGVAEFHAGDDAAALLHRADAALYGVKRARIAAAPPLRAVTGGESLKQRA